MSHHQHCTNIVHDQQGDVWISYGISCPLLWLGEMIEIQYGYSPLVHLKLHLFLISQECGGLVLQSKLIKTWGNNCTRYRNHGIIKSYRQRAYKCAMVQYYGQYTLIFNETTCLLKCKALRCQNDILNEIHTMG